MPDYTATDGAKLHYEVLGDGGPTVTLAGGAARHPEYLGDLAGMTGLVVPHLRGVGKSSTDRRVWPLPVGRAARRVPAGR
jgi:hypothetical protein